MATARRKPRKSSRSTKRTTRSRNNSSPITSVLALGAIVAAGAVSLWAVSQHKSPQTAIASLLNGNTTIRTTSSTTNNRATTPPPGAAIVTDKKEPNTHPTRTAQMEEKQVMRARAVAPAPRLATEGTATKPELAATQSSTILPPQPTMRPTNALSAVPAVKPNLKPSPKPNQVAVITPPAAARQNLPPRGINRPDSTPTMVYAKQKLTVHKTAWDQSPSMGEVEKGRELRSYGQTGKWHRVVVPATDMIGWVHQDMLVIAKRAAITQQAGQQNTPALAPLTTGSIKAGRAAKPLPVTAAKSAYSHPVPQRDVGTR